MKSTTNRPTHITKGNVFDDLGFSREDAAALKIKAKILSAILKHVKARKYTQARLVEILDEYQPVVSNLLNGKISQLSIEKLLKYAYRLRLDADIVMKERKARRAA
jgi:predicted XRE-type DNA-binding protein